MAKFERRLSISSLNEWIKDLEGTQKKLPKISLRIVDRLADEMMKDVYPHTEKIPSKIEGNVAIGGIRNTKPEAYIWKEMGTGIVGAQNPHVAEALQKAGWKYDVNQHGEKGWFYPKEDGSFGWTKGQPASKEFWKALQRAEEMFPTISREELLREVGR